MVTKSGHFGLGPAMAQKGDIVARLYGSKSLPKDDVFLLRATDKPLYYKFIGPAFIQYNRRTRDNQDTEQGNNIERDYAQKGRRGTRGIRRTSARISSCLLSDSPDRKQLLPKGPVTKTRELHNPINESI